MEASSFQASSLLHRSSVSAANPRGLAFCGLHRHVFAIKSSCGKMCLTGLKHQKQENLSSSSPWRVMASAGSNNGTPQAFDYDVIIIGAGVGGHGAALHAVEKVKLFVMGNIFASIRHGVNCKRSILSRCILQFSKQIGPCILLKNLHKVNSMPVFGSQVVLLEAQMHYQLIVVLVSSLINQFVR